MNILEGILLVGVVWCFTPVSSLDCLQSAVQSRAEECFSDVIADWNYTQLLNLSYTQLLSVITENPTLMCSDFESKKSAFLCLANATVSCMKVDDQIGSIMPDPHRTVDGVEYLCNHTQDVDTECVKDTQDADYQCIESRTTVSNFTFTSVQAHICEVFATFRDCRSETLGRCARNTRDVYVNYIENYLTPPECRSRPPQGVQNGSSVEQDCSPLTTSQETDNCYGQLSHTLEVGVPRVLDIVLADPAILCRHLKAFQNATNCAGNISKICFSTGQQSDIQPDFDILTSAMDHMCDHIDDVDSACIKRKHAVDLPPCVTSKARAAGKHPSFDDFLSARFLCWSIETTLGCLSEVLDSCSGQTRKIYLHFAHDYLTLPTCENFTTRADGWTGGVGSNAPHQPGDAGPTTYVTAGTDCPTGRASHSGMSSGLLWFLAALGLKTAGGYLQL
ncbi:uncharacterized protein [Littorina saxatilis]|uniref:Uncharacterized protein n=1 Tax=Littorina saxatilis TaxID=31220 RepID=A0AAN9BUN5_9CAEN